MKVQTLPHLGGRSQMKAPRSRRLRGWLAMAGVLQRLLVFQLVVASFTLGLAYRAGAADAPSALRFDGVDDIMVVSHDAALNSGELTITAWIKTAQTNGQPAIIGKFGAVDISGWQVFLSNGSLRARYHVSSSRFVGGPNGLNGGSVADNEWHQVAFVVDATGGRLQVDGALRAAQSWTGTPGAAFTTVDLRLGKTAGFDFFAGSIDEVTIWSRALSGTEIAAIRQQSFVGRESGLRALYHFAEGTGNRTVNSSAEGSRLDGTLFSGVEWERGVLLAPGATTIAPDAVTSRSVRLRGLASPGGTNTSAWFEWGSTTNYGNSTPIQPMGAGENAVEFSQFLEGLTAETVVHARAIASNALGVAHGSNVTVIPRGLSMFQERQGHTATLLPNGKVLVAGGYGTPLHLVNSPTNSAELFDPATGRWSPTGRMINSHGLHTATLLLNGRVLVMDLFGAELYDPSAGTWALTGLPGAPHNIHTATLLSDGRVLAAGGFGNQSEIYNPATGQWTLTGRLNVARSRHTATLLPNGKVLAAGGVDDNQNVLSSAELFDPVTGQWTLTESMHEARSVHTATLQLNGLVLVAGGAGRSNYLGSAERYDPLTGKWVSLDGSLTTARGNHTATLLPRGAIVVAGGYPVSPATVEILEPANNVWRVASATTTERSLHTATLLPSGQILLAGGNDPSGTPIAGAEIYEANFLSWTPATAMSTSRSGHTATLLPDSRVLVAGEGSAELYFPASNAWSNAPALHSPRSQHTATLLINGQVLVAGGVSTGFTATAVAELFDFDTGLWTETGSLQTPRYGHSATWLPNGQVLVAGGVPEIFGEPLAGAELFNPNTGLWTNATPMFAKRSGHTATLLPNGKVLVAGGGPDIFSGSDSAELFDPATGLWTETGSMTTNRVGHRATLLPNGTVLVVGGVPGAFQSAMASAEIFDPATGAWRLTGSMQARRLNPTSTLLPGGRVLVVGGFGDGYQNSAELYEPASGAWKLTEVMSSATYQHTATLLSNGKVLVTGGWTGNGGTNRAELFNADLGASLEMQPILFSCTSPLAPGERLRLAGANLRGVSGGSYGSDKDSATDHPVVQLRHLESEQTLSLLSTNWSTNTYNSLPLPMGFMPPGWVMATALVNGTPGISRLIEVGPAPAPMLTVERFSSNGARISWPSSSSAFVLQENPDLAATNWSNTPMAVTDNGTNRFITVHPAAGRRFYRLVKP